MERRVSRSTSPDGVGPILDRLRVLEVYEPRVGGVPRYVETLRELLPNLAVDVDVFGPPDLSRTQRYGRPRLLSALLAVPKLARRLQYYDLVHAHSSIAGMMVALARYGSKTPSIFTPHTWSFQRHLPAIVKFVYANLERTLARSHALVVTVSHSERDAAVKHRILDDSRVRVIHTGIPKGVHSLCRTEARAKFGIGPRTPVAAWVGRNDRQKRPDELVYLQQQLYGVCTFLALGTGLAGSGVAERLAAAGAIVAPDGSTPEEVYAAADMFVLTSEWEALPLSVLESMGFALPVIAYDVGDLRHVVRDDLEGYLIASLDRAEMVRRIEQLALDEILRLRLGSRASLRIGSVFGPDKMAREIVDAYRSVVTGL